MGRTLPPAAVLIAGPTASGKSALALAIADRLPAMIINADSMQVYRDLSVLTACPSADEQSRVPHRLYGYLDGAQAGSMVGWVGDAMSAIDEAVAAGLLPILVGGTGLYFKALVEGYADMPDIDPDIRRAVRMQVESGGAAALHQLLTREDPTMAARLNPGDGQRVARALEVIRSTGQSLASFQRQTMPGPLAPLLAHEQLVRVAIHYPRAELYARCDQRLEKMISQGGLEELATLLARRLDDTLPVMRALGVPQLRPYFETGKSLNDCLAVAQRETRRYAKRQMTWIRNQCKDWEFQIEKYNNADVDLICQKLFNMA